MHAYMNLLAELATYDRCHCGPEMERAYRKLVEYYRGARLLSFDTRNEINHWKLPPSWSCEVAELRDAQGNLIASRKRNNLEVFSYSPPVDKWVSHDELQDHLLSDPSRPDSIIFHFRNQYRHWAPQWGFSIPHRVRLGLSREDNYHVLIKSAFSFEHKLIQSDFLHQGKLDEQFLFMGHFDHPSQVNDGLAGCIAAYEVVRRLAGRETRYSYRAFASVEIVGSVAYLANEPEMGKITKEAMFLGFPGISAPLIYQQSFERKSMMDRIVRFLLGFDEQPASGRIFGHREIAGNDENVFDSVGYEVPTGTLMRWPFPEYHTDGDTMAITSESRIEETISFVLKIIDIIENNKYLAATYSGVPSLANPDIDLYFSFGSVSGIAGAATEQASSYDNALSPQEMKYLQDRPNLFYELMQNMLRMADGKHTILDVAEKSRVPFGLVHMYALRLQGKGLVQLESESS